MEGLEMARKGLELAGKKPGRAIKCQEKPGKNLKSLEKAREGLESARKCLEKLKKKPEKA